MAGADSSVVQIQSGSSKYVLHFHPAIPRRDSLALPNEASKSPRWNFVITDGWKVWSLLIKDDSNNRLDMIRKLIFDKKISLRINHTDNTMSVTFSSNPEQLALHYIEADDVRKLELSSLIFYLMDIVDTKMERKRRLDENSSTEMTVDSLVAAPAKQTKTRSLRPPPSRSKINPSLKKTGTKRGVDFD